MLNYWSRIIMRFGLLLLTSLALTGCSRSHETAAVSTPGTTSVMQTAETVPSPATDKVPMTDKISKTEEEWKKELTAEQFRVTRKKATERAFAGAYWNNHDKGTYQCVCCGQELFSSDAKFDSGTGWPSYWQPVSEQAVKTQQ